MRALARRAGRQADRADVLLAQARRSNVRFVPGPVRRVVRVTSGGAAPAATTRTS